MAIYQSRIDPIVDRKDNRAYDEAAALIGRIKELMERNAQREEFAVWLDAIRMKHKAKRNFMQRIENA